MRRRTWTVAVMLVTVLIAAACLNQAEGSGTRSTRADDTERPSGKPNIVFILTDDLSWNMVKYMSEVQRMRRNGTTLNNFYVSDSLCCPSRANIFTGLYPHHTGVRVNENYRGGGYQAFRRNGNEQRTFATALDKTGYQTAFMGKYINQYNLRGSPTPPGWDEWHVGDSSYSNVAGSYQISDVPHKKARKKVERPNVYLNDKLGRTARNTVDSAHRARKPFFLELASYAPHHRLAGKGSEPKFPAAERDRPKVGWPKGEFQHGDCGTRPNGRRYDCRKLKVPRGTGFDDATYRKLDRFYRDRVQMVQSLNDQMKALRHRLAKNGQWKNTYLVFGSDNGYHLGEHGLMRGKGSAYDHDTHVPLVVEGPGVRKGAVRREFGQTVDLNPTFQDLAGQKPKRSDGRSLARLLRSKTAPRGWRKGVLFEHRAQEKHPVAPRDPDLEGDETAAKGDQFVPAFHSYNAVRTKGRLYVEYLDTHRRELYDVRKDPGQKHNLAKQRPAEVTRLSRWLSAYTDCADDGKSCQQVGQSGP